MSEEGVDIHFLLVLLVFVVCVWRVGRVYPANAAVCVSTLNEKKLVFLLSRFSTFHFSLSHLPTLTTPMSFPLRTLRTLRTYATTTTTPKPTSTGGLRVTLTLPHTTPFPMQQSEMVILPTTDGVVGIGANHAPTIWEVVPGVVEVGSGGAGGNKWFGRFCFLLEADIGSGGWGGWGAWRG